MLRSHLLPLQNRLDISPLQRSNGSSRLRGLPCRRTDIRNTVRVGEDVLRLFEGLSGRLGEHEVNVDQHGCAEDAEDDVRLPADGLESNWYEEAQSGVEGPVCRGGQRHGLTTHAQGVQLGWVGPRCWPKGHCVTGDEEVCACDQTLGGGASQVHGFLGSCSLVVRDRCAV